MGPGKIFRLLLSVVAASAFLSVSLATPSYAENTGASSARLEFVITPEGEYFEIGDGEEYETADEYFNERYDITTEEYVRLTEASTDFTTFGRAEGYTTYGTLVINSGCGYASVDYYRTAAGAVTARFRVRYNISDGRATYWSPSKTFRTRGGHTFRHEYSNDFTGVRGEMRVNGKTYVTSWTRKC